MTRENKTLSTALEKGQAGSREKETGKLVKRKGKQLWTEVSGADTAILPKEGSAVDL